MEPNQTIVANEAERDERNFILTWMATFYTLVPAGLIASVKYGLPMLATTLVVAVVLVVFCGIYLGLVFGDR